jgi:hypothetical protein
MTMPLDASLTRFIDRFSSRGSEQARHSLQCTMRGDHPCSTQFLACKFEFLLDRLLHFLLQQWLNCNERYYLSFHLNRLQMVVLQKKYRIKSFRVTSFSSERILILSFCLLAWLVFHYRDLGSFPLWFLPHRCYLSLVKECFKRNPASRFITHSNTFNFCIPCAVVESLRTRCCRSSQNQSSYLTHLYPSPPFPAPAGCWATKQEHATFQQVK